MHTITIGYKALYMAMDTGDSHGFSHGHCSSSSGSYGGGGSGTIACVTASSSGGGGGGAGLVVLSSSTSSDPRDVQHQRGCHCSIVLPEKLGRPTALAFVWPGVIAIGFALGHVAYFRTDGRHIVTDVYERGSAGTNISRKITLYIPSSLPNL